MRQRHLHLIVAALALAAPGCFLFHGPGADGGAAVDGAPRDGSRSDGGMELDAACARVGGYAGCCDICGDPAVGCGHVCQPDALCVRYTSVCMPLSENDGCSRRTETGAFFGYCRAGAQTCAMPPAAAAIGGICLRDEYCREAPSHDIDIVCRYSDGTVFEDGPPDEGVCPPAPDPEFPFCGGSCGDCPAHPPPNPDFSAEWEVSCMGRNEERGFGICTFGGHSPCSRDNPFYAGLCGRVDPPLPMFFDGQPCACLVQRGPDGELPAEGVATFASSCRAYRARYPGAVECYEPSSWTPLD